MGRGVQNTDDETGRRHPRPTEKASTCPIISSKEEGDFGVAATWSHAPQQHERPTTVEVPTAEYGSASPVPNENASNLHSTRDIETGADADADVSTHTPSPDAVLDPAAEQMDGTSGSNGASTPVVRANQVTFAEAPSLIESSSRVGCNGSPRAHAAISSACSSTIHEAETPKSGSVMFNPITTQHTDPAENIGAIPADLSSRTTASDGERNTKEGTFSSNFSSTLSYRSERLLAALFVHVEQASTRWAALPIVALLLMFVVTFVVMVVGRIGFWILTTGLLVVGGYSIVDPAWQEDMRPFAVLGRASCWLALAILRGVLDSIYVTTFDPTTSGSEWQLVPMACMITQAVLVDLVLSGCVMFRCHVDPQPTMWRWLIGVAFSSSICYLGACSPFPIISVVGLISYAITVIFGLSYVVLIRDRRVRQLDVSNSYSCLGAVFSSGTMNFTLRIASAELPASIDSWEAIVKSVVLTLFSTSLLTIVIPGSKRAFGDDSHKLWAFALPGFFLAVELGQCALFLGSNIGSPQFWALIAMGSAHSFMKNVGLYGYMQIFAADKIGRPRTQGQIAKMEEEREALSPCDQFGEVAAPCVVLSAIFCETLFFASGIVPAAYLRDTGTLLSWRTRGGHHKARGEAPLMLIIVFAIRALCCWLQIGARSHLRKNTTSSLLRRSKVGSSSDDRVDATPALEECAAELEARKKRAAARKRASTIASLYGRLTQPSVDSPKHMRRIAACLIVMQPAALVLMAARYGGPDDV